MTSAQVGDSLDFDFFDSPRDTDTRPTSAGPARSSKPPTRPKSAKPTGRQGNRRTPSPSYSSSSSSGSRSPRRDHSSDNSDFLSDTEHAKDRGKNNSSYSKDRDLSRSESLSSLSSSGGSSRSRSRTPKRKASSRSSSNDSRSGSLPKKSANISSPKSKHNDNNPLPKRGPSRLRDNEYSSSAYSDEEDIIPTKKSPLSRAADSARRRSSGSTRRSSGSTRRSSGSSNGKDSKQRQAWGEESRNNNSSSNPPQRTRPTTAKASRSDRDRRPAARSDSESLSDSDMTDVSPIDSPRSYNNRHKTKTINASGDGGGGGGSKLKFRAMPGSHIDTYDEESVSDAHAPPSQGGLDLEILMKAVGELEKQKRMAANSRRVMFAPMTLKRNDKNNYTFDKNQSRDIDRENQRLLNEIVFRVHGEKRGPAYSSGGGQHRGVAAPGAFKLTASAVNRDRDMKRIENENMAFLKRLQKVKPTKAISRDHQIQSFESTQLHGVPIGALHPMPRTKSRPGSRHSVMDDTASIGSRTRSVSSLHSGVSSVRSRPNSRPTSRPCSATKRVDHRPEWTDRWN